MIEMLRWIASKRGDVPLHPSQRGELVHVPIIAEQTVIGVRLRQLRSARCRRRQQGKKLKLTNITPRLARLRPGKDAGRRRPAIDEAAAINLKQSPAACARRSAGCQIFRTRISSARLTYRAAPRRWVPVLHAVVAVSVGAPDPAPLQDGLGRRQRSAPVGGAAKGMPFQLCTPLAVAPRTMPLSTFTVVPAVADIAATIPQTSSPTAIVLILLSTCFDHGARDRAPMKYQRF